MKVLLTGGLGFIGSHIVDILIKNSFDVCIIDNLSTGKKERWNQKATLYEYDITNADKVDEVFQKEKPDYVIHTAANALLRKSLEEPIFDATSNIFGTINILESCRQYQIKKIIYTSTGGARYGKPQYLPMDENHPLNPTSPYGISKHTAEHYIYIYSEMYGLDYLILCFGNVYGPRDDPSCKRVTSIFSYQIIIDERPTIFGDGNQTRDFLYVLDLAQFLVECLDKKPKHKLFNLANSKQISVNKIFQILKDFSGFDKEPIYVDAIKGEVRDNLLDTTLAQTELGWSPRTDFKKGLEETYLWLKKNYSN